MLKFLKVILVLVCISLISAGSIFLYTKFANKSTPTVQNPVTKTPESSITPTEQGPLFEGTLTKLNQDLGLLIYTQADVENGIQKPIYYTAGVYRYSDYKGYTRIVVVKPANGPGGPSTYVFATKDFTTYVLDGNKYAADNFDMDSYNNPLNGMNLTKVTKVANLNTEHYVTINLDDNFGLFRANIPTIPETVSPNTDPSDTLITDVGPYNPVTLNKPNLSFYTTFNTGTKDAYNNFIQSDTSFYVKDETNLVYSYQMALKTNISSYVTNYQTYLEATAAYEKAHKINPNDTSLQYPPYPESPSFAFSSKDVKSTQNLYSKYSTAIPGACGFTTATKVLKNVSLTDLTSIGTLGDIPVYKLNDSQHPLIKQEFESKVNYDQSFFISVNKKDPPTYAAYIEENPLLVLKDPLGRFVAVGEYDYLIPGGCGKPVIYLYPEKKMDVTVRLTTPINFSHAIPSYDMTKGWVVTASPDGMLTNKLQTSTNCYALDNGFDSEYAKDACLKNSYPYLYWSGTSLNKTYPQIDQGWIVTQNDLENFLKEKLNYIGLNEKEIGDFISYWVPTMTKKNSPYFRVSFLQNKELNAMLPMQINPTPETSIRVFMDWEPLNIKESIQPQLLINTTRRGFTLVEWGGLKF